MRLRTTLVTAGLIASLTAMAAPGGLTADRTTVRAGGTITLHLDHGREDVGWISSPAFARTGRHPFGADEGLARILDDRDGTTEATATIATVPPGDYPVHTHVGGSAGPSMTITVSG